MSKLDDNKVRFLGYISDFTFVEYTDDNGIHLKFPAEGSKAHLVNLVFGLTHFSIEFDNVSGEGGEYIRVSGEKNIQKLKKLLDIIDFLKRKY